MGRGCLLKKFVLKGPESADAYELIEFSPVGRIPQFLHEPGPKLLVHTGRQLSPIEEGQPQGQSSGSQGVFNGGEGGEGQELAEAIALLREHGFKLLM